MAKKFAIFHNQQGVIDAIEQLEQAGFSPGEMKVLAKDWEHSRRIESETDVHADEMRELELTQEATAPFGDNPSTRVGVATAGAISVAGMGGFTTLAGGLPVALGAVTGDWDEDHQAAYAKSGLDSKESELCSQAVESGSVILYVETDESKALLDKDGGPDLSKLGIAEAVFRRCGADRIVDGS
ncbi:general stress protein [Paenibacillus sp. J5C_2022]|uniref:general stress protein n=1 Tax=Paenibacillus sp. J5C2022 TaxID=2977129 RepID=UPI0021D23C46|nr:general stress protein [Paenibacillus sp. J5C2022]MCU6711811.1 general stress protein [Paenibacillus sp. J5C2022]